MEVKILFKIGDRVVYPMQGAGIIKSIEDKEFLGKTQKYYIIKMLSNNMDIMIPLDKISDSNLRPVSDMSTLDKILSDFSNEEPTEENELSSKQRYSINKEKIKSGSLSDCAEVIHDLVLISKEKTLNSSEKQMLNCAKKFLIDEIILVKKISEREADNLLSKLIS